MFHAAECPDVAIRKAHFLGPFQGIHVGLAFAALQLFFHINNTFEPVQKPNIHFGDGIDLTGGESPTQRLRHHKQALIRDIDQQLFDLISVKVF